MRKGEITLDKIALTILIIGGLNWGCIGLFGFDVIGWIFGGQLALGSRIVFVIVAVAAFWCIHMLVDGDKEPAREAHEMKQ
ncbi:MAG TPA: DUF378 domain-containing protein [Ruminococcaceae bacterium]|nr:DUF378 domain-containing protein [Oscillospiraceae bacterium]